jgi:hypothetical protein
MRSLKIKDILNSVAVGGLVVVSFPLDPTFADSNPAQKIGFFKSNKIL